MSLLKKSLPLIAFCLFFSRLFFKPLDLTDAAILLILAATAAFFEYKESEPKIKEFESKLEEFKTTLERKEKDISYLKDSIAGIKLGNTLRPMGNIK